MTNVRFLLTASIFIHHQAEKLMRNYDHRENASIYLFSNSLNNGKSFRKYIDQTGELCVCVYQVIIVARRVATDQCH